MTPNQNEVLESYVKKNNKLIKDIADLENSIKDAESFDESNRCRIELLEEIMKHRRKHMTEILIIEANTLLNNLKQKFEKTSSLQILSEVEKIQ